MTDENEYVLGTHDDELRRLGFQHQVWAEQTAKLWEAARFAPGDRLLDLGSGPGYATVDLAQRVGRSGSVVAVDMSKRFLGALEALVAARDLHNVRWQENDAAALDLPDASINGVFARWLLCFTPDPGAVVKEVARVLAPGGRFAVLDYANYEALSMAPASDVVDRVLNATGESVRIRGGTFAVGRMLPHYMHDAGLDVEYLEPVVRIARPGSALWAWPESFFANYLSTLIQMSLITAQDAADFQSVWKARSADPSAYLITPTMVSVVGVKR